MCIGAGETDRPCACRANASATVLTYSPNGISAVSACRDSTISGGETVISMRNRLDESRVAQSLDGGPSGGESACPRARDIYVFRRPPARADQRWGRENGYRTTRPEETWTVPF